MTDPPAPMVPSPAADDQITDADRAAARARADRAIRGMLPIALASSALVNAIAALVVATAWSDLGPLGTAGALAAVASAVAAPAILAMIAVGRRASIDQLAATIASGRAMEGQARRREFGTRLMNALEMSDSEQECLDAAARAIGHIAPDGRVEVLLADHSHAHLERVLTTGTGTDAEGCPVASPGRCVAARRGQTQVFVDSDQLDACPKLSNRPQGRVSAVCVPVSMMGRSAGVVHHVGPPGEVPPGERIEELATLANQLGLRMGLLRVMAETTLQAGTDVLTGLANRRSFENRLRLLCQASTPFSVVMIDLDRFKHLNDTYGHDAGDRALRVFATVVGRSLRPADHPCRYGGEEFALLLPDCDADGALEVCERIREELALALRTGGIPPFTASFGVAEADGTFSPEELVSRADAALYRAKGEGRNRSVAYRPGDDTWRNATGFSSQVVDEGLELA